MLMKTRESWHCTNPGCQCEILVETSGQVEGSNPRCACGGLMKKQHKAPAATYLQFLRDVDEPLVAKRATQGE